MTFPRLRLAAQSGALPSARGASALLIRPPAGLDLSIFGAASVHIVQDMMPDAEMWAQAGVAVHDVIPDRKFDAVLVILPRAKLAARDWIARAMAVARDVVLVDGQKTDGVDSLLREMRRHVDVAGSISKAHGKLFWCAPSDAFAGWRAAPNLLGGRWKTVPGVFSAAHIDPASALLMSALPNEMSGTVVDLGAGWGFLAGSILDRAAAVTTLHLVEAHGAALACARHNITDPRAQFHWADATTWAGVSNADIVVMNPPFHTGRAAEPDLGQAFIKVAARVLRPGGQLFMVANRHLPYETTLRDYFAEVAEIGGTAKFKLFCAKLKARATH